MSEPTLSKSLRSWQMKCPECGTVDSQSSADEPRLTCGTCLYNRQVVVSLVVVNSVSETAPVPTGMECDGCGMVSPESDPSFLKAFAGKGHLFCRKGPGAWRLLFSGLVPHD